MAALKESEEKYRDFIEHAPIGVGIIDMSGKVVYINKRIEDLMGWSREKMISQYGFGLEAFDEDTRKQLLERFIARTEGDRPRLLEIRVARKNQSPLWVQVITTILKKNDVPVGAQAVFVNITERKEAEESLRKSELYSHLDSSSVRQLSRRDLPRFERRFARATTSRRT